MSSLKSVITCDLEGRIQTYNDGAAAIFGWQPDEVIGKKRVSLFSPGLTVLEHVPRWLSSAVANGAHETDTVFVRKDGSELAAHIRISPTYKHGTHVGYCGVTERLDDARIEAVRPPVALGTRIFRWLVVTRAPFLTATLVPVLVAAALAPVAWGAFALALVGALALHVAANTWNDLFDWRSGADADNNDYFLPFSGGSRAIELGLVDERTLARIAWTSLSIAALCGAALAYLVTPWVLAFGVAGAFAAYFYTAPPLQLAHRRGLGELFVGLCFGPLLVAGTYAALTGELSTTAALVGVPIGLLTTAILWINEIPDAPSDARVGKNHLVVTLGVSAARFVYVALLVGAYGAVAVLVALDLLPLQASMAPALSAPLAVRAVVVLFRHWNARELVVANKSTIQLHALFGFALALSLVIARLSA